MGGQFQPVKRERNREGAPFAALGIAIGAALVSAYLWSPKLRHSEADRLNDPYYQLHRFGEVMEAVTAKFVEEPDEGKLVGAAIRSMVRSLDPHSGYVDGNALRKLQSYKNGETGDIGLQLDRRNGVITIASIVDASPAANLGLRSGDVLSQSTVFPPTI